MNLGFRLATLLALGRAFSAASVAADTGPNGVVPPYVYAVGVVSSPTSGPDPFGLATVIVRDGAMNPIAGATVILDFSFCCDVRLCDSGSGHHCTSRTVSGLTDVQGRYRFTLLGAARDPGTASPPCQKEGCGARGAIVYANAGTGLIRIGETTVVALDQNGGAGGSNGTTGSDVSALIQLFGSIALGSPYRGRGDVDANGSISGSDVSALIAHFGRLSLIGGQGCPGAFCAQPDCLPPFFGPGNCQP